MNIQVNTDNHISGSDKLISHLQFSLSKKLKRYNIAMTRIEVHLSESKEGKHCQIEARISNKPPVVVGHCAETLHQAIKITIDKLLRSIDSLIGKMVDRKSSLKVFTTTPTEIEGE